MKGVCAVWQWKGDLLCCMREGTLVCIPRTTMKHPKLSLAALPCHWLTHPRSNSPMELVTAPVMSENPWFFFISRIEQGTPFKKNTSLFLPGVKWFFKKRLEDSSKNQFLSRKEAGVNWSADFFRITTSKSFEVKAPQTSWDHWKILETRHTSTLPTGWGV